LLISVVKSVTQSVPQSAPGTPPLQQLHFPNMQVVPTWHTLLHAPQLFESESVLTQAGIPLSRQLVNPASQTHVMIPPPLRGLGAQVEWAICVQSLLQQSVGVPEPQTMESGPSHLTCPFGHSQAAP
jgi:hypothetical protein